MFTKLLLGLVLVMLGWIIYRGIILSSAERAEKSRVSRGQRRAARIRGLAIFLLAAALFGVIVKIAFPDPVPSGYEGGGPANAWKVLLVFAAAALAGMTEARRYLRAGQKRIRDAESRE